MRPFLFTESVQISPLLCTLIFSSAHRFRSGDWDGHGRSLILCSVNHFCVNLDVFLWIIVLLEDPTTTHFSVSWQGQPDSDSKCPGMSWSSWCHVPKQGSWGPLEEKPTPQHYRTSTSTILTCRLFLVQAFFFLAQTHLQNTVVETSKFFQFDSFS